MLGRWMLAVSAAAMLPAASLAADLRTAIFAGGCFWCVEADFDKVPGVTETVSGYTGGDVANPSYAQVSNSDTGHYEAVRITFDAETVGYGRLVELFWRSVDPTDAGGQFCDRGDSYRTAVFALDAEQARLAEASRAEAQAALGREIVTPVIAAAPFWPAEAYHQDYYTKNPLRYRYYRWSCGRDARVRELWGEAAVFAGGS